MPGNLAFANPGFNVIPQGLHTVFVEAQSFPILTVNYHDSTVERSLITDGVNPSRPSRTWKLGRRLTSSQLTILLNFWDTIALGGLNPVIWYDPNGVLPGQQIGSNYDPFGFSSQGRVTVYFRGDWSHSLGIGRGDVPNLELVEVV